MTSEDRYSANMKFNQEIWDMIQAIKEENNLESVPQTIRFLVRKYTKEKR